ncbi:MAG: sulfotransferase [Rhizobiales bacterium]|nr:sulfotransferase [Hyphomicrobiales bacterium]
MASGEASGSSDFEVAGWVDRLGGHIERHPTFWIRLGNLESRFLKDDLARIRIEAPIYVAGLARSGSTFLLEALAAHGDTVTHRYKDFPPVFTPYWWNRFLGFMPKKQAAPAERAHKDGITITEDSPEAFEEALWMAFFPKLHDPRTSAMLGRDRTNPAFEAFYKDHIRKLLAVRGGKRYLSKGNYNLTRLAYLQTIFQDARFVLPVRAPAWHIASLIKQHRLFVGGLDGNPKALDHMRRVGHFEFGPDRRPINAGEDRAIQAIEVLWAEGEEVEGQARYWAHLHGKVADQLEADQRLRDAVLIVSYEALCAEPAPVIRRLFDHCGLPIGEGSVRELAAKVQFPTYYQPEFTDAERAMIDDITGPAAERLARLAGMSETPVGARIAAG